MNLVFAMILASSHIFRNFVTSHLWLDRKSFESNTFRLFWTPSAQNCSILHMKTKFYIKHIFMDKINSKSDHGAINCTFLGLLTIIWCGGWLTPTNPRFTPWTNTNEGCGRDPIHQSMRTAHFRQVLVTICFLSIINPTNSWSFCLPIPQIFLATIWKVFVATLVRNID